MHLECKEKRAGTYLNFSTIARFNSKSFALLIGTPQKVLVYDIAFSFERDEYNLQSAGKQESSDRNQEGERASMHADKFLLGGRDTARD